MSVKLRLKRMGRRHRAFFRLNAIESRNPRDGRVIEQLGWYDPKATDPAQRCSLDKERIEHWLEVGAIPSETVASLLENNGIGPNAREPKPVPAATAPPASSPTATTSASEPKPAETGGDAPGEEPPAEEAGA